MAEWAIKRRQTKRNSKIAGNEAIDRISDLPDSLLSHILSFVSTKVAVSTSLLSKRWNRVWLSVFSLHFDDRSFSHQNFVSFVNHVLQLRQSQFIQIFRLKCSNFDLGSMPFVQNWTRTAIQHRVETLDLCFTSNWNIVLPPSVLCCKTLVVLKLTGKSIKTLPFGDVTVDLPSLRILHLHFFLFSHYKYLNNLVSGCKLLEELVLKSTVFFKKSSLGDHFESLPMLKTANIPSLIPLTVMQNLQCLHLDLIFFHSYIAVDYFFLPRGHVPAECLSSSLKTFKYRESLGLDCACKLQFVKYIMENARVLRTLKICSTKCCNMQVVRKSLSSCTPISENCQLMFDSQVISCGMTSK